MQHWKVGELAKRTGLSVRALHHYDALGVLVPSARSAAGYRLYTEGDVTRLQQVVSLRRLGLALEEIRSLLDEDKLSVREVVGLHLARLREELEAEWPRLMAAVRAEMEKGTDPADAEVQRLMVRWRELIAEFTGDDAGIEKSLGSLLSNEGEALRQQHGSAPDPELMGYVARAMAARG